MPQFFKLTLRTLDVQDARAFYRSVFGADADLLDIVPLHEQALARGARPHWLGFIQVDDIDRTAAAFVERGATLMGPKWKNPEGLEAVVLRDPGGALVALGKPAQTANPLGIPAAGYLLNTQRVDKAKTDYQSLFGWHFAQALDLGSLGVFHPFAWEQGGQPIGVFSGIEERTGVHPHWQFQFHVPNLAEAARAIQRGGGVMRDPIALPNGDHLIVGDDPQGAAFALVAPKDTHPGHV